MAKISTKKSGCATTHPSPLQVLSHCHVKVMGCNAAGFLLAHCPFHKNGQEKNPSLNMHGIEGYYRCHACGASGGGVVDLVMAMHGWSYRQAIENLKNW